MADRQARVRYHRPDPETMAIMGGLVAWFWATAASNLPLRQFDRLRRRDRPGPLLPNWRFFAPSPVTHDYEVVYRTRAAGVVDPCWRVALAATPRRGIDAIWMPVRRRDKALVDIVTDLIGPSAASDTARAEWTHDVLAAAAAAAARREIRVTGDRFEVQFAVLKHDGYAGGGRRLTHLSGFAPPAGTRSPPARSGSRWR